ncbi:hypothetical protein MFLAVUS_006591 [Mucor flavus]|uniref:OTU domain-containing protein n=1 Tax=Mucor flavus TaxID=439312 RepID=A0ABP9Z1Z0_9FUNG
MKKEKEHWVGYYANKLRYLGNGTSDRAEGAHSEIKTALGKVSTGKISSVTNKLDAWYRKKSDERSAHAEIEMLGMSASLYDKTLEYKFVELRNKVVRFAMDRIHGKSIEMIVAVVVVVEGEEEEEEEEEKEVLDLVEEVTEAVTEKVKSSSVINHIDYPAENAYNLKRIISNILIGINDISDNIITNVLPPAFNMNTKGRRKGTKRMDIRQLAELRVIERSSKKTKPNTNHPDIITVGIPVIELKARYIQYIIKNNITKLEAFIDPMGDGNCGFRAISIAIYGDQKYWIQVKEKMYETYMKFYNNLYVSYQPDHEKHQYMLTTTEAPNWNLSARFNTDFCPQIYTSTQNQLAIQKQNHQLK